MPSVVIGGGSHLFNFDDGTTTQFVSNSSPHDLTIPDDGVNFSWSTGTTGTPHTIWHSLGDENLNFVASSADAVTLQLAGTSLYFVSPTINITSMVGAWQISYFTTAGTAYVPLTAMTGSFTVPAATSLAISGNILAIRFTNSTSGQISITSINTSVNCFVGDTLISTPKGEVAVENLAKGDFVTLADGTDVRIKAIGETFVNPRLCNPKTMNPIQIAKNALGQGMPSRDLMVSPDHAIEIDGVLYTAGSLANGDSISQLPRMPLDGFTYYHIETENHALVLANNVPAETFIDYAGRTGFEHSAPSVGSITEMALQRVSGAAMVPASLKNRLTGKKAA